VDEYSCAAGDHVTWMEDVVVETVAYELAKFYGICIALSDTSDNVDSGNWVRLRRDINSSDMKAYHNFCRMCPEDYDELLHSSPRRIQHCRSLGRRLGTPFLPGSETLICPLSHPVSQLLKTGSCVFC